MGMRIRSIRPEFWTGEKVRKLSPWARLLLIGLNNYCDDEGRGEWDLPIIKAKIFPTDRISVSKVLRELTEVGAIVRYRVDGRDYLAIPNWHELQRPNRPQPSKLPPFSDESVIKQGISEQSVNNHGAVNEGSLPYGTVQYSSSTVQDSNSTVQSTDPNEASFGLFWTQWPEKQARAKAKIAWAKLKPDKHLLQTILNAIEAQKTWDRWKRGIIPGAAAWLNGKRWNDEKPQEGYNAARNSDRPVCEPGKYDGIAKTAVERMPKSL